MTKIPINLQDLRRKIYIKAKGEEAWRFWGIYVHVWKIETLQEAYKQARKAAKKTRKEARISMKLFGVKATKSARTRNRAINSVRRSKELIPAATVTSTALPEFTAVQTATTAA